MKLLNTCASALALLATGAAAGGVVSPIAACRQEHPAGSRDLVKCIKAVGRSKFEENKQRERDAFDAQRTIEKQRFLDKRRDEIEAFQEKKQQEQEAFENQRELELEKFLLNREEELKVFKEQKQSEVSARNQEREENQIALREEKDAAKVRLAELKKEVAQRKKVEFEARKSEAVGKKQAAQAKKREEIAIHAAKKADAVFRWAMTKYQIADHHSCLAEADDSADHFYASLAQVVSAGDSGNRHEYSIAFNYQGTFSVITYDHGMRVDTVRVKDGQYSGSEVSGYNKGVWKVLLNEYYEGEYAYDYILELLSAADSITPKFYVCPYSGTE